MASVKVEFAAYSDPRFRLLGRLIGEHEFSVIGRTSALWMFCTERNEDTLLREVVDAYVEVEGFSDALIRSGLAEATDDHSIRIKGAKGRIEWLNEARARQKAASLARSKKPPISEPKSEPISDPKLESISTPISTSMSGIGIGSSSSLRSAEAKKIDRVLVSSLAAVWLSTLKHFGIDRNLSEHDEIQIARAAHAFGHDTVELALYGARYEPATETFRPREHVSLTRILDARKIESHANRGAANKAPSRKVFDPDAPESTAC